MVTFNPLCPFAILSLLPGMVLTKCSILRCKLDQGMNWEGQGATLLPELPSVTNP